MNDVREKAERLERSCLAQGWTAECLDQLAVYQGYLALEALCGELLGAAASLLEIIQHGDPGSADTSCEEETISKAQALVPTLTASKE